MADHQFNGSYGVPPIVTPPPPPAPAPQPQPAPQQPAGQQGGAK